MSASLSREYSRAARANTAGAANSAQSVNVFAPISSCCSLAAAVLSCIASMRARGSSRWVANAANITETRLPSWPFSSEERTEIGTVATSGSSGNSPRPARYERNAPAQIPNTTSFTVHSSAVFTRRISSRETSANETERCGVIAALNDVRGAWKNGETGGVVSGSRLRWRSDNVMSTVRRSALAILSGKGASSATARVTISRSLGMRSGFQGFVGGAVGAGFASRSSSATSSSAPETPSIAA